MRALRGRRRAHAAHALETEPAPRPMERNDAGHAARHDPTGPDRGVPAVQRNDAGHAAQHDPTGPDRGVPAVQPAAAPRGVTTTRGASGLARRVLIGRPARTGGTVDEGHQRAGAVTDPHHAGAPRVDPTPGAADPAEAGRQRPPPRSGDPSRRRRRSGGVWRDEERSKSGAPKRGEGRVGGSGPRPRTTNPHRRQSGSSTTRRRHQGRGRATAAGLEGCRQPSNPCHRS